MNLERLTKCSAKFALRLKRSGKSSWRSVEIADISWYVLGKNVVVKDLNMLDDDDDDYDDGDGDDDDDDQGGQDAEPGPPAAGRPARRLHGEVRIPRHR